MTFIVQLKDMRPRERAALYRARRGMRLNTLNDEGQMITCVFDGEEWVEE